MTDDEWIKAQIARFAEKGYWIQMGNGNLGDLLLQAIQRERSRCAGIILREQGQWIGSPWFRRCTEIADAIERGD